MKKIVSLILVTTLTFSCTVFAFDRNYDYLNDSTIYGEQVQNIYTGSTENTDKIQNLKFDDIQGNTFAESIIRMGAFNVIKGENSSYNPNDLVTNEEVIAFLVRMNGLENEALTAAETIRAENEELSNLWSLGYLNVAVQMGLLQQRDFNQALSTDQASLDPDTSFLRADPVKREQLAVWLYDMIRLNDPLAYPLDETVQSVLTFNDYGDISVENIQKIEAITSSGVMSGTSDNTFSPNGTVTRGEVAEILSNVDSYYYAQMGYEEKSGTVGAVKVEIDQNIIGREANADVYVRNSYGAVDVLRNYFNNDLSPQTKSANAPVYRGGTVYGLSSLLPDDTIEYVVDTENNKIIYVQVVEQSTPSQNAQGKLLNVDFTNNTLTIIDSNEVSYIYPIASSEIDENGLYIDRKKYTVGEIPIGSTVELELLNNVALNIKYIGEDVLIDEFRAIVLENNPQLGYMIVIDNDGKRHNMKYYSNDIIVEKQQYYDIDDEIGYIDEVFPSFEYDPRDTFISEVEVGDIVFIRPYEDDTLTIQSISATTNYTMKYGQIKQIVPTENTTNILVEFENGATSYYEVPNNSPITKDGKFLNRNDIMVGDYAKFLVNQAIISPGYVEESVKEIVVEGSANYVNSIIKGNVIGYDAIQNNLLVDNTRVLTAGNWSNYNGIESLKINKNIEIYNNGERTSMDYLNRYLREGTAYVAVKNSYSGDEVKKVSVYSGRDELLDRDTVVTSSPTGDFILLNGYRQVSSDDGTIVVRHGRLIDNNNIQPYDYGSVALNGGNHASVVEILDKPNDGGKMIARGRILSVDEGDSFSVKSMVVLEDTDWIYTPVEREFEIDQNTVFLINNQVLPYDEFIAYTTTTQIDNVYNIVSNGIYAEVVTDSVYAKHSIRGTVYETADGTILLNDVLYRDIDSNDWDTLSDLNNTATVNVAFNSIVTKNGQVIKATDLIKGEQVLVMTTELPEEKTGGMTIDGIIVTVEKY